MGSSKPKKQNAASRTVAGHTTHVQAQTQKQHSGRPTQADGNFKTDLNNYISAVLRRPLTKEDIVYTVAQTDLGLFQATVTLTTTGQDFAGEPAEDEKQAKMNAAQQALIANESEIQQVGSKLGI